ncbi:MAG: IPT/TIG domain-containing protein [Chitinophagaceae bacterium]|nr:IPT/TIG domain-containing protein [Chitinophagaceae bacterium]
MKSYIKISNFRWAVLMGSFTGLLLGCTKKDFSEDYDIDWPVPVITNVSPVKQTIGQNITITGEKFEKLSKVTIGTPEIEAKVISSSATSIVVEVPRTANTGPVTVSTLYKQKGVSTQIFEPVYLNAKVTNWPTRITRGQAFVIRGENMDMVLEVDVDGNKIPINPAPGAATHQQSVGTNGLTLPDAVVVKITKARAGIENGTSGSIPVENPTDFFIPEAPILMFDFETGSNPYVNYGGSTATSGFNTSGAPKGRAQRYLTVQKTNAVAWEGLGEVNYTTPINLALFHKPHMTFLVNTRGKDGYMQVEFVQGGTKWGMHFKPANSSFDYNLATNGWTWVSVPKGTIDAVNFGFKRGNGTSSDYEINIDQLMITDGAQKPVFWGWNFEDNVNPYSGSATNGLNLSAIPTISGDKYLTVGLANAANWNWTGDMYAGGPINLSNVANAYINFWVNTNGKKGFFQIETNQSDVKWGGNLDANDYLVETTGWKLYSLRLADIAWSKWGGSGTATTLDAKGILDYLKIGFSTGNVSGPYEVNIDDVVISDGPMF